MYVAKISKLLATPTSTRTGLGENNPRRLVKLIQIFNLIRLCRLYAH